MPSLSCVDSLKLECRIPFYSYRQGDGVGNENFGGGQLMPRGRCGGGDVKFTLERSRRLRGGLELYLYSFFILGARWGGGQRHASAALPPGKTWYPLYRKRGGAQGWSGGVRKILPQPRFDPRTVQPVASRYTDWAITAVEGGEVPCWNDDVQATITCRTGMSYWWFRRTRVLFRRVASKANPKNIIDEAYL
jgi:hypothetical protein